MCIAMQPPVILYIQCGQQDTQHTAQPSTQKKNHREVLQLQYIIQRKEKEAIYNILATQSHAFALLAAE